MALRRPVIHPCRPPGQLRATRAPVPPRDALVAHLAGRPASSRHSGATFDRDGARGRGGHCAALNGFALICREKRCLRGSSRSVPRALVLLRVRSVRAGPMEKKKAFLARSALVARAEARSARVVKHMASQRQFGRVVGQFNYRWSLAKLVIKFGKAQPFSYFAQAASRPALPTQRIRALQFRRPARLREWMWMHEWPQQRFVRFLQ